MFTSPFKVSFQDDVKPRPSNRFGIVIVLVGIRTYALYNRTRLMKWIIISLFVVSFDTFLLGVLTFLYPIKVYVLVAVGMSVLFSENGTCKYTLKYALSADIGTNA